MCRENAMKFLYDLANAVEETNNIHAKYIQMRCAKIKPVMANK